MRVRSEMVFIALICEPLVCGTWTKKKNHRGPPGPLTDAPGIARFRVGQLALLKGDFGGLTQGKMALGTGVE